MGTHWSLFLSDVETCPVTVVLIAVTIWFQLKLSLGEWQLSSIQVSHQETYTKREFFRVILALFAHSSSVHTLFDVISLWLLRIVERSYGTPFYLKYTLLMVIFESAFSLSIIAWIKSKSQINIDENPNIATYLFGCSGLIMAWLGFLSIDLVMHNQFVHFYIFGIIPIPISIAPIIVMLLSQTWSPRSHSISHAGGLAAGYLLAFKVLRILDSEFWTWSFLFDLFLGIFWLKIFVPFDSNNLQQIQQTNEQRRQQRRNRARRARDDPSSRRFSLFSYCFGFEENENNENNDIIEFRDFSNLQRTNESNIEMSYLSQEHEPFLASSRSNYSNQSIISNRNEFNEINENEFNDSINGNNNSDNSVNGNDNSNASSTNNALSANFLRNFLSNSQIRHRGSYSPLLQNEPDDSNV